MASVHFRSHRAILTCRSRRPWAYEEAPLVDLFAQVVRDVVVAVFEAEEKCPLEAHVAQVDPGTSRRGSEASEVPQGSHASSSEAERQAFWSCASIFVIFHVTCNLARAVVVA